ncbi:MAG: fibronectin type III domain-containing protein [Bacteroidota bacterium]
MKVLYCTLLLFSSLLSFAQTRDKDPVVIRGNNLPCMLGVTPDQVVAFAYNGSWQQIPVQIDEIVVKDISDAYGRRNDCLDRSSEDVVWDVEYYADTNTDVGPDDDLRFDANDELVFMAKDAGQSANTNNCPNGVIANTKCKIIVRDPLNNAIWGYVYVFQQTGSLNPSAGRNYVTYNYSYADNYKTAYDVCVFSGTNNNPENSVVTTSEYNTEFSQRWVEDVLKITAGNANGQDILDRHQIFINANACNRNEQVFSDGKGPIVTNKDGPVRAIRSVMGAKSGTFTEQTIKFTQYQAAYTIYYRLHTANGYSDVFDFSSAATGMQYYSDRSPAGVTINGNPDVVDTDEPAEWELITGNQGSLVTTFEWETDITSGTRQQFNAGDKQGYISGYYSDKGANADFTCTGDGRSYGSCGFSIDTKECTDRRADFDDYPECIPATVKRFTEFRTHYYLPPNTSTSQANRYGDFGRNPLTTSSQAMGGCQGSGNEPTCDDGIQNGDETGVDCGGSCPPCQTEPTCDDGIQNGDETGVDCGGSCPPCQTEPTCDDGIQNGDETGVDCGGSCPPCMMESCDAPTGLFETNNTGSQITLNWMAVASANTYNIQGRQAGTNPWRLNTSSSTNSVTLTNNIVNGISYEWRVRAVCDGDESPYSEIATFTAGDNSGEPTCDDGIQNGDETGVDCGGSCPPCQTEPTCDDGIQNGDETGVDCGGSCPPCQTEPTCDDGIQNGDETGVDCGGSCPPCQTEPTCDDGIQNGDETGIDCGGSCPPCQVSVCEIPTNLVTNNIQGSSADLNWEAVPNAVDYTVQLRQIGRTNWNTRTTPTNMGIAQPLRRNTTYEWRVRANCSDESSPYSAIATFTTASSAADLENRGAKVSLPLRAKVFPSPTSNWLYVEANQHVQRIRISDFTGRLVHEIVVDDLQNRLEIDVSEWIDGHYFVQIQAEEDTQLLRFVKVE